MLRPNLRHRAEISNAVANALFVFGSLVLTVAPQIVVKLLSGMLGTLLKLPIAWGVQLLLEVLLIFLAMVILIRYRMHQAGQGKILPEEVSGIVKLVLMQGGLFSAALLLEQSYAGHLQGSFSLAAVSSALAALLPIFAGAIGEQFIRKAYTSGEMRQDLRDQVKMHIIHTIQELLARQDRITQRMVSTQLKIDGDDNAINEALIQSCMAEFVSNRHYRHVVDMRTTRVILDSFRHPDNWSLIIIPYNKEKGH